MKGGTYAITKKIDLGATRPGVAGGIMKLYAVAGTKPIIDASGLDKVEVTKTGIGIHLKASYWHIKGIEIVNAPHNCIKVEGGFNTIENMVVHHCGNTGITIGQYSGTDMSAGPGSNNTILNCDSYGNVGIDGRGEDADGFGAKEQAGKNNVFKGCRSWNNADDGYDFYGWADPISVQDCWSFENAKMGAAGGDGNGFKLGNGAGGHTVTNAISAYNVKTAYTSNGASKLSTCTNCKQCSNGSVTGSGDHGINGSIATMSPCADLKKAEGARNADSSLPSL
jgi:Right handed beta helix region